MTVTAQEQLLIFGAQGAIGACLFDHFKQKEWNVTGTARSGGANYGEHSLLEVDPFSLEWNPSVLSQFGPYTSVIWAQGSNLNDSIQNVDLDAHLDLYRANCLFIVATLRALLDQKQLKQGARLCIISSIWQEISRPGKFSYSVTKSALRGLVSSVAADLAPEKIVVNAVLPGPLDTTMTRNHLSPDQLERIESATGFARLPTLSEVTHTVDMLCSPANTGITGQFIAVDLGFSHVKNL